MYVFYSDISIYYLCILVSFYLCEIDKREVKNCRQMETYVD